MGPVALNACLDTDYRDACARVACVLFEDWESPEPSRIYHAVLDRVAPYQPGAFYQRELPCLLQVLSQVKEPLNTLVIDGFVWLGEDRPGLGRHLYEALGRSAAVIGVAKTNFRGSEGVALPLYRGKSRNPLWITAAGMGVSEAVGRIGRMAGEYRLPELIKRADRACREWDLGV